MRAPGRLLRRGNKTADPGSVWTAGREERSIGSDDDDGRAERVSQRVDHSGYTVAQSFPGQRFLLLDHASQLAQLISGYFVDHGTSDGNKTASAPALRNQNRQRTSGGDDSFRYLRERSAAAKGDGGDVGPG